MFPRWVQEYLETRSPVDLYRCSGLVYDAFCHGYSAEEIAREIGQPVNQIEAVLVHFERIINGKSTVPAIPETFITG